MAINHNEIAEQIMKQYTIKTFRDTKESYYYNPKTNLYEPAETLLEELVQSECQEDTRNTIINETISSIKRQTYINIDEFEAPSNLIPLQNGVYDLLQKNLIDYNPTMYFTNKHPITYNPEATCPTIDNFFKQIVKEKDIQALYEIAGYCLYRKYPLQKFFLFTGSAGGGKSTVLNLYIHLLGTEAVCSTPMQDLAEDKFATVRLFKKNANIYADLDSTIVKRPGKLKILTGDDRVPAQKKHMDGFEFWNYAKLIFSANNPPKINDDSDAIWRRLHLIVFPYSFEGDPDLGLADMLKQELSGFLNKALVGLENCLKNKSFSGALSKEELIDYYHKLTDSAYSFIEDECEFNIDYVCSKTWLYAAYRLYCGDKKLPLMSDKAFYGSVRENFGERVYESRFREELSQEFKRVFKGVTLFKDSVYRPKED